MQFSNTKEDGLESIIANWLVNQNGYEQGTNADYNGFSRESATFIKKHKNEYVVHDGSTDELRLRLSLLNCGNTSVMTEAASIRFNAPKLFLEEEA